MAEGLGIAGLGQVAVGVTDLERAIGFYRDVLGLRYLFRAPPGLGFFDCGGVRVMLDLSLGADKTSILYFRSGDIEGAFRDLAANNVAVVSPPHKVADLVDHSLWLGFFKDSEGNTLALMEERPR